MLERLLADVDPERGRASSTRALEGRELARRRRRAAARAREGADLHALLAARPTLARATTRATTSPSSSAATSTSRTSATWAALLRLLAPPRTRPTPTTTRWRRSSRRRATRSRAARPRSASRAASTREGPHPLPRDPRRAQARVPEAPHPRLLARGDRLRPPEERACRSRSYLRWLVGRGPRHDAGHRGRDPRRRDPRDRLAAQAAARDALGRDREGRARDRAALDLDDHVRPHRAAAPRRRATSALIREHPEGDGRLHRVRAARLHPREERALQPHARAARRVDARGPAPDRGGAPLPAARGSRTSRCRG